MNEHVNDELSKTTDEHAEDRDDEPDPSVFWAVCDF